MVVVGFEVHVLVEVSCPAERVGMRLGSLVLVRVRQKEPLRRTKSYLRIASLRNPQNDNVRPTGTNFDGGGSGGRGTAGAAAREALDGVPGLLPTNEGIGASAIVGAELARHPGCSRLAQRQCGDQESGQR